MGYDMRLEPWHTHGTAAHKKGLLVGPGCKVLEGYGVGQAATYYGSRSIILGYVIGLVLLGLQGPFLLPRHHVWLLPGCYLENQIKTDIL